MTDVQTCPVWSVCDHETARGRDVEQKEDATWTGLMGVFVLEPMVPGMGLEAQIPGERSCHFGVFAL